MLVFFSARRLKPGAYDDFRSAWEPEGLRDNVPEGAVAVYHARNIKDPDEVISFGLFDGGTDRIGEVQGDEDAEAKRQEAMAAFINDTPLEGIYEVVEEIRP